MYVDFLRTKYILHGLWDKYPTPYDGTQAVYNLKLLIFS